MEKKKKQNQKPHSNFRLYVRYIFARRKKRLTMYISLVGTTLMTKVPNWTIIFLTRSGARIFHVRGLLSKFWMSDETENTGKFSLEGITGLNG